jgi:hypothetical protein
VIRERSLIVRYDCPGSHLHIVPARPDLLRRSQVVPVPRRMLSATRESQSEISVLLGRSFSVQTSLPGGTAFGRAVPPGEGSMAQDWVEMLTGMAGESGLGVSRRWASASTRTNSAAPG